MRGTRSCTVEKVWKHPDGVAFIVRKEVVRNIISCTPVSSRLFSIRTSARTHNITVIQVYTPSSDHKDEEVLQLYEQLDNIIAKTPKKDIVVVQGTWKDKVGPDAYQHWAGTAGRFGSEETNDRRWRLLEFAKRHLLTLANTLHPHTLFRTVHSKIDFIMTPNASRPGLKNWLLSTENFLGYLSDTVIVCRLSTVMNFQVEKKA